MLVLTKCQIVATSYMLVRIGSGEVGINPRPQRSTDHGQTAQVDAVVHAAGGSLTLTLK